MAQQKPVEMTADGIIVYPSAAPSVKAVRLQAVSPAIIQVTASPSQVIQKDTTLMVVHQPRYTEWTVTTTGNECLLATPKVRAYVSLQTGAVRFTDKEGKAVLQTEKGGSAFTPVAIEKGNAFAVQQSFVSTPTEAFYGLGQHQQGIVNYKGEIVELLQNNTEVAIPFLVSSRNYGILWDQYSISRFGDGRTYQSLSALPLFDAAGKAGGLTATYTLKKTGTVVTARTESGIAYDYLPSLEKFPSTFSLNEGKVTWQGFLQPTTSGLHKFAVRYGGYVKLWLDDKLVVDNWRQCWNPAMVMVPATLQKGKRYAFKMEWIPDGGESFISCHWMRPPTAADNNRFLFQSEAGDNINYYFVYGRNLDDVISGYRTLTGKAPIVPQWAMGFWQSRERYKSQGEIMETVKVFRSRGIPLDNIVMDWQYWKPDAWGSQEFDPSRFPDPEGMIDSLHRLYNTHFMISVWPKFYTSVKNFSTFNGKGWLLTGNVQDNRKDWLGYVSTFYDAYNPQAGKAFWQLIRESLYTKGVDAWWMDAPEPDIHSNLSIEQRKRLMYPNAIGSSIKYFNAYPLLNAKPIYEGQRGDDPSKRVFILTRSAYSGSQRYGAAVWSGDIGSRWHDLKHQVAAGVNFSLSGLPYWTMDIGGFAVEHRFENAKGADAAEWKELNTRWYQFGAFCPLFRVHGQFPFRELYNVAGEKDTAYQGMLFYNKLRYRLLPYTYSLAAKTYFEDYTLMRGLAMDFAADPNVLSINDQYLFGPSLLISPVYTFGQRSRPVYLPKQIGWYNLYTGRYYAGGQTLNAAAPYDRMPVFVKEGSILPFGPELEYTSQKPADTVHLFVYTGKDAAFRLYEDEGTNYNYEKGSYAVIPVTYAEATKTITLHKREGGFPGMLNRRVFTITWIRKDNPMALNFNQVHTTTIYKGEAVSIKMN